VIQYQAPLFRALAARSEVDLTVYFCDTRGAEESLDSGFGKRFRWDTKLLDGYGYKFLRNLSPFPSPERFLGVLNPGIIRELYRQRFDAVIIHGYALAAYWLGYLGAWLSGTQVLFRGECVLRPNRPWWIRVGKRVLLSALFSRTAAFLVIGSKSREFYTALGIPEAKLYFTPYAVDNDFFMDESERWRPRRGELKGEMGFGELPVVMYCGKLLERKRPFDLLQAYEGIQRDAGLLFVGDGHLRPGLERYVEERGFSYVRFSGFVNQSELPKYYALADVFVLPSGEGEVSPLVINEAMCCGLPVVVSDAVPSADDFVRNGENGYIYPCGDLDHLGRILRRCVLEEGLRRDMGVRSKEMIRGWGTPEAVEGILDALRGVGSQSG
jgi:glycosyltransferase involved in cell wall biosynthesis